MKKVRRLILMTLILALLSGGLGTLAPAALGEGSCSVTVSIGKEVNITVPEAVRLALYRVGSRAGDGWVLDGAYASAGDFINETDAAAEKVEALIDDSVEWVKADYLDSKQSVTFRGLEEGVYFVRKVESDKLRREASKEVDMTGFFVMLTGSVLAEATPKVRLVTEASVRKEWEDNDDQDGKRPEAITVRLLADGVAVSPAVEVKLSESGGWSATVGHLTKYNASGAAIEYTWEEIDLPDTYTLQRAQKDEDDVFVITNSHETELTEVTVTKSWLDNSNQDGKRPGSIRAQLYANGVSSGDPVTLTADRDWTETVTNLPKYEGGKEIEYTWREIETGLPEGYVYEGSEAKDESTTVLKNRYSPEETEAKVVKVWDDDGNRDGQRPESLEVTLLKTVEGVKTSVQTLTLNEKNGWSGEIDKLPRYENGKQIAYSWQEGELPEGYSLESTDVNGVVTTLTNQYDVETVNLEIQKIWEDDDDRDGLRPDSLKVTLKNGDEVIKTLTLDESNNWRGRVENLPRYENPTGSDTALGESREIVYTWSEDEVSGYKLTPEPAERTSEGALKTTLTNEHVPAETEIHVVKVWDDQNNQDGKRGESVTVRLLANDEKVGADLTLNDKNNWKGDWTGLKAYEGGEEIVYRVVEVSTPEGYTVSCDPASGAGGTTFKVTNSYTPEETSLSVTKKWSDDDDRDGKRPASITVRLLADGAQIDSQVLTPDSTGKWYYKWESLPAKANGETIAYTVEEDPVTDYATTYPEQGADWVIDNAHTPETTQISVEKIWDDNDDQDGLRQSVMIHLLANGKKVGEISLPHDGSLKYTWQDLPVYENGRRITYAVEEPEVPSGYAATPGGNAAEGFTITNAHTPETTSVKVVKTWKNAGDENPPASLSVQLYADGAKCGDAVTLTGPDWTYEWTGLDKYSAGEEIQYTVVETLPENYTKTRDEETTAGIVLENTYTPGKTSVSVTKIWDDDGDRDGKRPDSIKVRLLADGAVIDEKTIEPDASGKWACEWTELDAATADGAKIVYTVQEVVDDSLSDYSAPGIEGSAAEGFTITNSHEVETTSISVRKEWDDGYNRDQLRPDSVTVYLKANGAVLSDKTQVLNADNNWSYTWKDLPVNEKGEKITYTVVEAEKPSGYEDSYKGSAAEGFTITNTHEPETVRVGVSKTWRDSGTFADGTEKSAIRPSSITIRLYADGEEIDHVTVAADEEGNWEYAFTGLPKHNTDGTDIQYTIKEDAIPGYETTYEGYNVINTVPVGSLQVEKIVTVNGSSGTGNSYADGRFTFTVTSLDDSSFKPITFTITSTNGTLSPNPMTINDLKPGKYRVTETSATPSSWSRTATAVNGSKVSTAWADLTVTANNTSNMPMASFTNNRTVSTTSSTPTPTPVVTPTPTPSPTPTGLVPGEEPTPTPSPTPSPTPIPLTDLTVTKTWADNNDEHEVRPRSVTIRLLANGRVVETVTLTGSGNRWSHTFRDLPTADENGPISYTTEEVSVPYYDSAVSGLNITNSIQPRTPGGYTSVSGTKTWNDNANESGARPNYITVYLLRNGEVVERRIVTAANNWQYSFTNLPTDDGYGHTYSYSVREEAVSGYFMRQEGNNLINSRLPDNPTRPTPTPSPTPEPGATPTPTPEPGSTPAPTPTPPPTTRKTGTPKPPFEEQTEEDLEEFLDLFDYDTPLFGMMQTGEETPVYPFVFGGIGILAIVALLLVSRKRDRRRPSPARR